MSRTCRIVWRRNQAILDNLADGILVIPRVTVRSRSMQRSDKSDFACEHRDLIGASIDRFIPAAPKLVNKSRFLSEFVERSHSKQNVIGAEIEARSHEWRYFSC